VIELLLTVLALYGLQCVVLLPRGATLSLVFAGTAVRFEGPGWRMLHPWPSAWSWPASRPQVRRDGAKLRTLGPTAFFGAGFAVGDGVALEPSGGQRVEVRGTRVLVGGVPALRGLDASHAAELGSLCRALTARGADVEALLEESLARAFDVDALLERRGRAADATRWLSRVADASALALFALLPGLGLWLGSERALLVFGPAYLALHVAGAGLFVRAHRRLRPSAAGERFESVFAAALYPPLLLRSAQELRRRALAGFHPAAVAFVALRPHAALDALRGDLGRASTARERAGIEDLIARLGSSAEELLSAPERSDPLAQGYCATCRTEYRRASGSCIDCGAPLARF
jgi:hypothetical protein